MNSSVVVSLLLIFLTYADNFCERNEVQTDSLYEQHCCNESNKGKAIIITDTQVNKYILCPPETPSSCANAQFPSSCSDILKSYPTSTSGYYNITQLNSSMITVYCDMEGVNCDGEGGWMRVAYLNMSYPTEECPDGFGLREDEGIRSCSKQQSKGCRSLIFPSNDVKYSSVCGRVTGYQVGVLYALWPQVQSAFLNKAYVEGVSITSGSPRKHVWTFMAATWETSFSHNGRGSCPCAPGSLVEPQPFVDKDYFCESGNNQFSYSYTTFYNDPLWDGEQCGAIEGNCCNVTGLPWFNKVLEKPTTDYIELRVCSFWEEGELLLASHEIYVK